MGGGDGGGRRLDGRDVGDVEGKDGESRGVSRAEFGEGGGAGGVAAGGDHATARGASATGHGGVGALQQLTDHLEADAARRALHQGDVVARGHVRRGR